MIHAPDGKLRFSPSDLVSYLEGDFAAWCDRMFAERGRAHGAGSARARVGHPRRGQGARARRPEGPGARATLAGGASGAGARAGRDHLGRPVRARAHRRRHARRRPRDLPAPPRGRRLAGPPRLPLPLPRQRLRLRRLPLHAVGRQARPVRQALLPGPALRLRRHARGPAGVPAHRAGLHPRAGHRAAVRDPPLLPLLPAAQAVVRHLPGPVGAGRGAGPRPRPELGALGRRRREAARRVRSPEPGGRHLARPGAEAGGGRDRVADRARRVRRRPARAPGVGSRVRAAPRPGPAPARLPRARPPPLAAPAARARGAAPRAGAAAAAVRQRRLLRHGGVPVRRRGTGVPVRRGDRGRGRSPVPRLVGARRGRGEGGVRGVHRLGRRAVAAGSDAPHLPLRLVRGLRRQAAHGQVRHARGRGGRSAPPRGLRGPVRRGAAGVRDRHAELLAQGGGAAVPAVARGRRRLGQRLGDRVPAVDGPRRVAAVGGVAGPEEHPGLQPGGLRVDVGASELAAGAAAGERHGLCAEPVSSERSEGRQPSTAPSLGSG